MLINSVNIFLQSFTGDQKSSYFRGSIFARKAELMLHKTQLRRFRKWVEKEGERVDILKS